MLTFNQSPIVAVTYPLTTPTMPEQSNMPTVSYKLATLLKAQLFGKPESTTGHSPVHSAPKTKLDLTLHGIYHSTKVGASMAMITNTKGKSKLYKKGDALPSGGTIYQIQPTQVVLLRNNRQETLLLTKSKPNANTMTSKHYPVQTIHSATDSTSKSPAKLLGEYQQQLRTNPQKLRNLLRVIPYSQEGKFIGYQLKPGRNKALMAKFNLQVGDILTEVNGVTFDSPLKGLEVIQQLATTRQVNVRVLRNGQPISLSFMIEK